MENFDKDYEDGNNIEKLVLNLILKKYPKAYIKEGYFKGWDIHIPEVDKTVEVKFDRVAETGKNILIEIESNNEPSGMSTTKADFWVIYDNIKFYWFKTEQIRKCIYDNKLHWREYKANQDNKLKKAYMINKELLLKYKLNKQK